jgi:hypothetical protein
MRLRPRLLVPLLLAVASCGDDSADPSPPDAEPTDAASVEDAADRAISSTCWSPPTATCDPRAPARDCGEGARCDLVIDPDAPSNRLGLVCVEGEHLLGPGASCDDAAGETCRPGLRCHEQRCAVFCCSSAECPRGSGCNALAGGLGRLGVCDAIDDAPLPDGGLPPNPDPRPPGPACGRVGDFCQFSDQCCSRNCFEGYCR